MEHLVDLDGLEARLGSTVEQWRRRATVGPLTWRDANASWPQPIVTDRAVIEVPGSLGIRLSLDPDDEMEVVVWTSGWADVLMVMDGQRVDLCPEFKDVDGAYAAVVRNVEDFLAQGR